MKDSWNPTQYEKFKNERSQPFFDLLSMVERHAFDQIVDLGCGSGELTEVLAKTLSPRSAIGIDRSQAMLEKVKSVALPNLKFKVQDIELFREPGKYDLIFSNAALQWCEHHPKILENIKTSLTPQGQLAIQMPMNHDYPTHTIAAQVADREPYASFLKVNENTFKSRALLKPEEYATILYRLGFKRQSVSMKVYSHMLNSRADVIEWVKGSLLTYYQSSLPPEIYEMFLKEYTHTLFSELLDDRPFFYPFKRLLLWASLK